MAGNKGSISTSMPLSNIAVGYKNLQFIGTEVLKIVPVDKQVGKYYIFGQDSFDIVDATRGNN